MATSGGSVSKHQDHWERFYARSPGASEPALVSPSPFAESVQAVIQPQSRLVELGCGNGRDASFFAAAGHDVLAVDYSAAALRAIEERSRQSDHSSAGELQLMRADLYEESELVSLVSAARSWLSEAPPDGQVVYMRFFLHALEEHGQANALRFLSGVLTPGAEAHLEFRTITDSDAPHVFGEHFRSFIDDAALVNELPNHGLEVVEKVVDRGLAKYREEDPMVCRLRLRRAASL